MSVADSLQGQPLRVGVAAATQVRLQSGMRDEQRDRGSLESFCQALAAAVHQRVVGERFANYGELQHATIEGRVELAWLPPLAGVRVVTSGHGVPVALPVRGGSISYWSALFSACDSTVRSLEDIRSVRAVWVDRTSTSGYRVIRAWLRSEGTDLTKAFSDERFIGSHAGTVEAVLRGSADVGATYAHLSKDRTRIIRAGWEKERVHVVGLAGPIPSDLMIASVRLPVSVIRAIQRALALSSSDVARAGAALLEAEGFVAAESEHLAPLGALIDHLDGTTLRSIPPPR
jgi:ABC-type phosphate/phosphonate transport system substrate-binding protein